MHQAMPDRSLITRLRTDGGPSHELLVLLDRHRVLTSTQLARLTGTPQRTVSYRLDRLHAARLVEYARPGRESGSAPRHWWLTPTGARLVAGVAPAEGKRPSAMFAAHAATIAEVWLAVLEHGPPAGITPVDWWPDRAGWQEWTTRGGRGEARLITPDAILTVDLPGAGAAVACIEVDLATMTQTQLRAKVGRYLEYADDRAWAGVWPHCPPLLLLTTTPARAQTWVRAAVRLVDAHRRSRGSDMRFARRGAAGRDVADAERLVVAACGLVRDPAVAVTDRVWMVSDDAAADTDLAGLLAGRVAAQAVAADHYAALDADRRAAERRRTLYDIAGDADLPQLLGDPVAADVLTRLVGHDATAFTTAHPHLAEQALAWWPHRDTQPADDVDQADVVDELRAGLRLQHARIWAEQARLLLAAAGADPGDADPRTQHAAAELGAGRLLPAWQADQLAGAGRSRAVVQRTLLGDHPARRARAVDEQWQALGRWARRRVDPAELAAGYDDTRLLVCDLCAVAVPCRSDHDDNGRDVGDDCPACWRGHLIDYRQRGQVPALTDRLAAIRDRLAAAAW